MLSQLCLIDNSLYCLGSSLTPVYLLKDAGDSWILVDSGILTHWQDVATQLKYIVGDLKKIHYWLITHAHHDHCGIVEKLYASLPNVTIVASQKTKELLHREKYADVIRRLNLELSGISHTSYSSYTPFPNIPIQAVLPGGRFSFGGRDVCVIDSAGHCEDMVSYWFVEPKILFCADSLGDCFMKRRWRPLIFYDAQKYVDTISRLEQLTPRHVLMGHQSFVHTHIADLGVFVEARQSVADFTKELDAMILAGQSKSDIAKNLCAIVLPSVSTFISENVLYKSYSTMINLLTKKAPM